MSRLGRVCLILLVLLLALVLALTFWWVAPGPLTIDDVTYHRMMRGLVAGHGFFVDNGYAELQSVELTSLFIHPTATGKLAAQYPYGGTIAAAPLYVAFGIRGMFLINALGYVTAIGLSYRIAMQVVRDRVVAVVGAALLAATYFTEYAFAIWPHAASVACVLGAMTLAIDSYQDPRRSLAVPAGAGFVAGVGLTMRLDVALCVPSMIAPFLFASRTRGRELAAIAGGFVPGLVFLAISNYARWDTWFPLTYGPAQDGPRYVAFGLAGVSAIMLAWLATRARLLGWLSQRRKLVVLAAFSALIGYLIILPTAPRGLLAIVADLRARPIEPNVFVDNRALSFFGDFKKALLQSCPFLILAVLPVVDAIRGRRERIAVAWLACIPVSLIGFYGTFSWHGGIGINLRYLLPALPFLSILAAWGLRDLASRATPHWPLFAASGAAATLAAYAFLLPDAFESRCWFLLSAPLMIAALVLIGARAHAPRAATTAMTLAALGVAWSIASTVHDAMWSQRVREHNHSSSVLAAALLPEDALVFVMMPEPFYGIVEYKPSTRIAISSVDNYRDAARIARHELERGRRVFAIYPPSSIGTLQSHGHLSDTITRVISPIGPYVLGEVQR
jgi:hypothetical protein